ncbi:MAG: AmmeMemoRadiSam system radical SAM enzyme [Anaerostipes sp.]|uniref:AmmeMemoRadiSam system radical SAM enzyme n=1 Tax=Anaerostipes sp. TaxID=1872530 RepID=UPI003991F572
MKQICQVCMHRCELDEGQTGRCRGRKNTGGKIICDNYGKITSAALDPIEKKPLKMFYPGSKILSLGSYGCNLSCPFCQNHEISMVGAGQVNYFSVTPEEVCEKAESLRPYGNIGVAFTYNEPLISYEFVRDTAKLLRQKDLKTVVVTNGSVTENIAREILPLVDGLNIDLKGFTEEYYKSLGGDLEVVKKFIAQAAGQCHVELTTLIIPGQNDTEEEIRCMTQWIASVNPEIVLHITRFFPNWKMTDRGPTNTEKIYKLAETAREVLPYVFTGNC